MNEDFVEIWILDIEAPQSQRSFEAGFQHRRGRRPGFELNRQRLLLCASIERTPEGFQAGARPPQSPE